MCIRDRYNVELSFNKFPIYVAGPFPVTADGNRYIMFIGDYFTKWVEAYAIPNQEVTTVTKVLVYNFCCCYKSLMEVKEFFKNYVAYLVCERTRQHLSILSALEWLRSSMGHLSNAY